MQSHMKLKPYLIALGAIIAALLSALPLQECAAAESVQPQLQIPFGYKQYHVHYDVYADGSYIESAEVAMSVLNEQGVQFARQVQVSTRNMEMPGAKLDIEVLVAYTLKKSGQRIDAAVVVPAIGTPLDRMRFVAFQGAEVGDTLVMSYKATQKKSVFPNNIVLNVMFPKSMEYDDAAISLSAPAALNLRTDEFEVEKVKSTADGQFQKWEWKFKNKTPVVYGPHEPQSSFGVHISTFRDHDSEREAIQEAFGMGSRRCNGNMPSEYYSQEVARLFWADGNSLERLVSAWDAPSCLFKDGRPIMMALGSGYSEAFRHERDWSKAYARIDVLKKQFPSKAFVALAEANYWITYAWDARGSGYASSVSDDGWKLFRERLEKAEKILVDTKSYSATLPLWYSAMIEVQSALGRPEDERDKIFLEGAKRYPGHHPIYFTMLNYLSPKWGGTWRTVDNLVKWSVEHTKAVEGNSMYARLYWVASGGSPDINLFKDTFASWPKMKQGFEDLMVRHPKSEWNLNNFAKFSCMAGDKQTFLALRAQIGKDVMDDAWPENTSLDLCETKFGYAQ